MNATAMLITDYVAVLIAGAMVSCLFGAAFCAGALIRSIATEKRRDRNR